MPPLPTLAVETHGVRAIGWTRTRWAALRDLTGGVYVTFAGFGEENDALARAAHGVNHARLVDLKRRYDPDNRFRATINIAP